MRNRLNWTEEQARALGFDSLADLLDSEEENRAEQEEPQRRAEQETERRFAEWLAFPGDRA